MVRAGSELALALGPPFWYAERMKRSSVLVRQKKTKRIGRPPRPGGRDPSVTVRIPRHVLAEVDRWATDNDASRSDAVRELLERALRPQN